MSELEWSTRPDVQRPILLAAFEGWFDAGEAATGAIDWITQLYETEPIAYIDAETFFDFQQQRPLIHFDDQGHRQIEWPHSKATAANIEGANHDVVLVSGVEPHLRWNTFTESVTEIASVVGAELVVTLGSNYGTVPHTRPPEVVGSSTNRSLASRLGLGEPSYQGPTGVIGALHQRLDDAEIPVISLRVNTPHYVQGGHNPNATQALLRRLELICGFDTDAAGLDEEIVAWQNRVTEAVSEDVEVSQYVVMLEQQVDESVEPLGGLGDLAAEVEAFLRERNDE
ncbi:MAG: PAC2 family protein [Acidobacteria bacterium]|nr:PAC2 family protein [Acidobacteriota bacterium]